MSTPCDGVIECIDGTDENNCGFPIWLVPSILLTSVILLICFCFISLKIDIKKSINGIKLRLESQKCTEIDLPKKSRRQLRIAYFTEVRQYDEIMNLLNREIEYHGSEGGAICCLKV